MLPVDYGPATDPHDGAGEPLVESVWIEPYPDEPLGVEDGLAAPEARYEQRESVELAFIAALQHLPGHPARGADPARGARLLGRRRSPRRSTRRSPSVNSALQRARKAVDEKLPEPASRRRCARSATSGSREIVDGYVDAWERGDVDAVVAMLAEDAAWSMPPLASWFRGRDDDRASSSPRGPLSGAWRWRHRPHARQRPAGPRRLHLGRGAGAYLPFALNVLTLRGDQITDVTAFIMRSTEATARPTRAGPTSRSSGAARWPTSRGSGSRASSSSLEDRVRAAGTSLAGPRPRSSDLKTRGDGPIAAPDSGEGRWGLDRGKGRCERAGRHRDGRARPLAPGAAAQTPASHVVTTGLAVPSQPLAWGADGQL